MVNNGCFWGAEVEGLSGLVSVPRHKPAALAVFLISFASLGMRTAELLEMSCGQLAYVFCFRRPLMAVPSHAYRQGGEGEGRDRTYKLGTWARNELECTALLLPLAMTNLQAKSHGTFVGVDASLDAAGGVGTLLGSIGNRTIMAPYTLALATNTFGQPY